MTEQPLVVVKFGQLIPIAHVQALAYGIVQPTEAEQVEQEARRARWRQIWAERRAETQAWLPRLHSIIDPLSVKILELHARDERNCCTNCVRDEMDNEDWPCATVRLVADHHGMPAPEWVEFDE